MAVTPDPTNPAARRPLQPGEADLGAKQLEALTWAKQQAPSDPNGQQILSSQYLYKKYGILPNNGQGDWQHSGSGGPLGWELKNGDLVPKDRSWFDKYGMLAVAGGILTAGTLSAVLGPSAAASAGGSGVVGGGGSTAAGGSAAAAGGSAAAGGGSVVPWGTIINAGSNLFGSLFNAHAQSDAADKASATTAAASKYAADLQDAANKRAEAFTRQQSENEYQNQEVARKGNYDQYRAQRSRLGTLGAMLGLPAPEIPDYVPSVDPQFTGGGSAPPTGAPTTGAPAAGGDAVTQALLDNYKALGVTPTGPGSGPTDIAYFTKQAKDALAAGERPLSYWLGPQGRVAQELAKAKGGAAPAAAPVVTPPTGGTLAAFAQPYQVANPTAALNPYGTGTLARMAY